MIEQKKVCAVIPAAGKGKRMQMGYNKIFMPLANQTLLYWTLQALLSSQIIDFLVIGVAMEELSQVRSIIANLQNNQEKFYCLQGGKERSETVRNALHWLHNNKEYEIVLIHDAARPLISPLLIKKLIQKAIKEGIAVPFILPVDTVRLKYEKKLVNLPRDKVYLTQTPQVFHKKYIFETFLRDDKHILDFPDEASYAEYCGHKIAFIEGEITNRKITFPEDLQFAEWYITHQRKNYENL